MHIHIGNPDAYIENHQAYIGNPDDAYIGKKPLDIIANDEKEGVYKWEESAWNNQATLAP